MRENIPVTCFGVSVIVLRNKAGEVDTLLMKRKQSPEGTWCQVAGRLEKAETGWQAALREMKEETGLEPTDFYSTDYCEQYYSADKNEIEIVPVFVAYVDELAEVRLNDEHSDYEWLDIEAAIRRVSFPGQRRMLTQIKEVFIDNQPPKRLKIDILR